MLDSETPTFLGQPLACCREDLDGADVVVIGSPYVVPAPDYAGISTDDLRRGPRRVRQQSARYGTYLQDLDIDLRQLRIVDYGDVEFPDQDPGLPASAGILAAQECVIGKVRDALDAGALPIVLGLNSPCATYALGKPVVERCEGTTAVVSLDAHWDAAPLDWLTEDPRIAGSGSWKHRLYADYPEKLPRSGLVDIGERGLLEDRDQIRRFTAAGATFVSGWQLGTGDGLALADQAIDRVCAENDQVMFFLDMDVLGGAGPGPGDIFGELAEPLGMTDHQLCQLARSVGSRNVAGVSVAAIPPETPVHHRTLVYALSFLLAGRIEGRA